jgi:O-antigen ligase
MRSNGTGNIPPTMTLDRKRIAQIADWEAVAVAVSLPWSTSATSILLVAWLVTVLASLDVATVRREVKTAAGGLPVMLWLIAAAGMLWADVSWAERIDGLGGFHRLLVIPLLLAQFRRSGNGMRVLYGFFAAAIVLLLASWTLVLDPNLTWLHANPVYGVPVKDDISQSTIFLICAFVLIWRVCDSLREKNWRLASALAVLAVLFLANLVFVAASRADILVAPFLIVLLGWRQFQWKGAVIACVAGAILAAGSWASSHYLRERLAVAVADVDAYRLTNANNDIGDHVEFLRKSVGFVRAAPWIGHGTGSIASEFRRSAAGETGAAAVASVNPHNQIFAVAIQLGMLGTIVLLAMWIAHYFLFRVTGFTAWIGTVVVVENVVSSLVSSHLFDFMHGWLYVLGVGVVGGMVSRRASIESETGGERA